jgi:hypothetical protein
MLFFLALSLIMEGILSACYHVCPSYTNFQFGKFKDFQDFVVKNMEAMNLRRHLQQ